MSAGDIAAASSRLSLAHVARQLRNETEEAIFMNARQYLATIFGKWFAEATTGRESRVSLAYDTGQQKECYSCGEPSRTTQTCRRDIKSYVGVRWRNATQRNTQGNESRASRDERTLTFADESWRSRFNCRKCERARACGVLTTLQGTATSARPRTRRRRA